MQYLQDLRDVCRDKGVDFFSADRVFYIEDKKDKNNTVNGYGSAQKLKVNRELRQGFGIPSGNVRVHSKDFYGHERGGLKTGRKMSAERGILVFKSLIIKDSDY